jgi:(5-formylfuran-3-yl)methyl phosphate transaminase
MEPNEQHVSRRAEAIRPFVVMDVVARAKELAAMGNDVVRLEIGDPDLPTPAVITRAAEAAMEQGDTGYTQSAGLPSLREAVAAHYLSAYGATVDPEDIVVTQGTSPAMLLVFGALLDPGDEVIVSDPCYPAYPNYVNFLGGVPVTVPVRAEEGFRFRPDEIRAAITPRTRAIMVNSPCNPTGTVLPPEDLEELATIAEEHGVWIVSDEIYHGLDFSGRSRSILEFTDRAFVLNGFSKVYAMTGWRLGYLIAPPVRAPLREDPAELLPVRQPLRSGCRYCRADSGAGRGRPHAGDLRRAPPLPRPGASRHRSRGRVRAHRRVLRLRGRAGMGRRLARAVASHPGGGVRLHGARDRFRTRR